MDSRRLSFCPLTLACIKRNSNTIIPAHSICIKFLNAAENSDNFEMTETLFSYPNVLTLHETLTYYDYIESASINYSVMNY